MANKVNLKINNIPVTVDAGTTILEAARQCGIKIPTLCYLKDINAIGACRVCVCEVKGARSLVAACVYPVNEGMEVFTNTERVLNSRKTTVELIMSDHKKECLSCIRNNNCELQTLSNELGCDASKYAGVTNSYPIDNSTPYIVRDNDKCVLCRRCVAACNQYQSVAVIGANGRGFDTHIACAFEKPLSEAIDRLDVSDCMLVGEGGKKQNITCLSSVKSDLFESIAGAIYLDGGIEPAKKFVLENLAEELENAKADAKDAKSKLNEYGSKHGVEIEYKLLSETGADHNPQFVFEVVVDDKVMGKGTGGTKREAQQNCAKIALSKLSKQKKR